MSRLAVIVAAARPLVLVVVAADVVTAGVSALLFARHRPVAGLVVIAFSVVSLLTGVVFLARRGGGAR